MLPAGTTMERVVTKDMGSFLTVYWCRACQEYLDTARKIDPYIGQRGFQEGYVRMCRQEAY